jgi:hypothetical protein
VIYCMHAINQVGTCGIPYAIPHSMGNQVQTKNPEQGCWGVFENETSGGAEVLSGLGIYRDRNGRRPSASAHGDSTEVFGESCDRGIEDKYEQGIE